MAIRVLGVGGGKICGERGWMVGVVSRVLGLWRIRWGEKLRIVAGTLFVAVAL